MNVTPTRAASPLAVVAAAVVLLTVSRFSSWDEPPVRDAATYAVVAHEMLHGRSLYTEVWDLKPPGIYLLFAGIETMVGYGPQTLWVAGLAGALLALGALFRAGSVRGTGPGLAAALCWALVSADLPLEANDTNTEVYLNAVLAAIASLLLRSGDRPLRGRAWLLGGLIASGSLLKQLVVVPAAALVLAWVIVRTDRGRDGRAIRETLRDLAVAGSVVLTAWAACTLVFAASGRLGDFVATVFTFTSAYVRDGLVPGVAEPTPWALLGGFLGALTPPPTPIFAILGLPTLLGLARGWIRRDPAWLLLGAWTLSVPITAALPGRGFPHYHQFWLPVLCLGAAWAAADFERSLVPRLTERAARRAGLVVRASLWVVLACTQVPVYSLSVTEQSSLKYGDTFVRTRTAADEIHRLLPDGERFYYWGPAASLHFDTGRRPASGIFLHFAVRRGPLQERLSRRLLDDLRAAPPVLVVLPVPRSRFGAPPKPVADWIRARYRPDPGNRGRDPWFHLYWLRGSKSPPRPRGGNA